MAVSSRTWDRLVESEVGNRDHRLYGGSQYHRTLREFNLATKCLRLPTISEDEITNAAGMGETHDGVNFLHAACTIALEKARVSFDPLLGALQLRMTHVMGQLCPVTEFMLRESRERMKTSTYQLVEDDEPEEEDKLEGMEQAMDISQNPQFRQLIRSIFDKFVRKCSDSAMSKCRDDLTAITRYVSWNLDERSSGALSRALPDQTDIVAVYKVAIRSSEASSKRSSSKSESSKSKADKSSEALTPAEPLSPMVNSGSDVDRDYQNLLQLMEEAVMMRDANRTNMVVGGLVQHIVSHWRHQFCRSVTSKFNCYFMLPFVDEFHRFMRRELQKIYEGEGDNLTEVFDLTAARRSLQLHREELMSECMANKRLQEKFQVCARMMRSTKEKDSVFGTSSRYRRDEPDLDD